MSADDDELTERLAQLGRVLLTDGGLDASLDRVAKLSTSLIDACDSCGVSLAIDGKVSTRAASDDRADRVDEIQYSQGEGPCLSAIETGVPVLVDSFRVEDRWMAFIDRARTEGIRASYSVPLRVTDDAVVGSLNFYSTDGPFGDRDQLIGDLLAAQAAVGLRNAQTFADALTMVDQLNEALATRDVIGQAKGMLMARLDLDADAAFDALRTASQHGNVKLREIAEQVADGQLDAADLI